MFKRLILSKMHFCQVIKKSHTFRLAENFYLEVFMIAAKKMKTFQRRYFALNMKGNSINRVNSKILNCLVGRSEQLLALIEKVQPLLMMAKSKYLPTSFRICRPSIVDFNHMKSPLNEKKGAQKITYFSAQKFKTTTTSDPRFIR